MGDDVAIRIPCIRRMLGDHRSPHFLMPLNDNLPHQRHIHKNAPDISVGGVKRM